MAADPSEPVLESTIGSALANAANDYPDHPGLVSGDPAVKGRRRWTFAEMHTQALIVAGTLLNHYKPGERIAVWAPNIPEWVLLQLGVGMAGLVLVPLNPVFRKSELEYALKQSQAAGIFYVPEYRDNPLADWVAEAKINIPTLRETVSFADWDLFLGSGISKQSPVRRGPTQCHDSWSQRQSNRNRSPSDRYPEGRTFPNC